MKLTYLGTAAAEGWPALFCSCSSCRKARELGGKNIRTRSQALVDDQILLDFCPDTYMHILQNELDMTQITDIFVTHSHSDHFYPTDLMMKGEPYAQNGEKHPIYVYGTGKVKQFYDRMLKEENDSENLNECVKFREIVPFMTYQTGDYRVTPLLAKHDPAEVCVFYAIEKQVQDNHHSILYAHDTALFPKESAAWIQSYAAQGHVFDLISLDCTMGMLENGSTHMALKGCIDTKKLLIEMGAADENTVFVLNHFSHNQGAGLCHEEMEQEAEHYGFLTAYDGMVIG